MGFENPWRLGLQQNQKRMRDLVSILDPVILHIAPPIDIVRVASVKATVKGLDGPLVIHPSNNKSSGASAVQAAPKQSSGGSSSGWSLDMPRSSWPTGYNLHTMTHKLALAEILRIAAEIFRFIERLAGQQVTRGGGFSLEMPARVHAWRRPDVRRIFGTPEAPLRQRYFADMHIGGSRPSSC